MLQVGFGIGDLTPAPGDAMPSIFGSVIGKGVQDKLLAVACVLFDGTTPVVLVGIDAAFIYRSNVDAVRRRILKTTRIPGDNVLISASHTHTGGPIIPWGCDENPVYQEKAARAITAAVTDAWHSLHAAEIGIGTGREASIAFNRRFLMRDGREITHPGKPGTPHHQEIVCPAGPVDPEVGVLAARNSRGEVTGIVVNFTCHCTVLSADQFSPDYVGYLRKHLRAYYGEKTPVVFLQGACGDITQVDNLSAGREFGTDCADMMGAKLAAETIRVLGGVTWLKEATMAVAVETAPLALRSLVDAERERPAFGLGTGEKMEAVYADEREVVAKLRRTAPWIPCEVQALRIGPLGIAAIGAEYFCEYGLRIKQCSGLKPTWVAGLANDWLGYIPTAQAHTAGGYEPRTASSSKMSIDAGQHLLERALKVLRRVTPDPLK